MLALPWVLPGSFVAAIFGWASALMLIGWSESSHRPYRNIFIISLLAHLAPFYWVVGTIEGFSGFSFFTCVGLFLVFVILSSLQFVIFAVLRNYLPRSLDRFALRGSIAWATVEFAPVRIFPWQFAHTQISVIPFIQIAEIFGTISISFLVFWFSEAVYFAYKKERSIRVLLIPAIVTLFSCVFGLVRIHQYSLPPEHSMTVSLVQSSGVVREDTKGLQQLTEDITEATDLVIWPEGALSFDINESIFNTKFDARLPNFSKSFPLLFGARTFRKPVKNFNSAILINEDNSIPLPYHKVELIPFGEYVPFTQTFPWMHHLSRNKSVLTPGEGVKIFDIPVEGLSEKTAKISPLICYEEVIPYLAREASVAGAEVLVSLSDDGWLDKSVKVAIYQHYIIGAFRSIENRKTLLRATTTGLTAVVSPTGELQASLPLHSNEVLTSRIGLYSGNTFYNSVLGDTHWKVLTLLVLISLLLTFIKNTLFRSK